MISHSFNRRWLLVGLSTLTLLVGGSAVTTTTHTHASSNQVTVVSHHFSNQTFAIKSSHARHRRHHKKNTRYNRNEIKGKRDSYNFFMDPNDESEQRHMEKANINSKYYRRGFIKEATSARNAKNVLLALNKYHHYHNRNFRKGWSNGLYANTDENLTDSPIASNSQFDKGWYYGDLLNNGGNMRYTKNDWNDFVNP